MGGQHHAPAVLLPRKTRYPLYGRLGWPQGRSGRVRKITPPSPSNAIRSPDRPVRSQSLSWPMQKFVHARTTLVLSEVQTVLVWDFTDSISCRILIRYLVWQEYGSLFGTGQYKSRFMRNEDGWLSSLPRVWPPLLLDGAKMAVFHGMCETYCVTQQPVTFCFRYLLLPMMRYCTCTTDRIL